MYVLNLINEAFFNPSPVKIAACGLASLWFRSAQVLQILYGYAKTG